MVSRSTANGIRARIARSLAVALLSSAQRGDTETLDTTARVGRVVRAGDSYTGKQGPNYTPGVSAETVGSRELWLGTVTLPPGGARTRAHVHDGHESAFYLLSGERVELWTGDRLEHREQAQAGDYLFIPAGVAHVAVNRSETTPAVFIGARSDPNEQESVVMRPELDSLVP
jgi:uncharacterized RmlC-like cupin family protein